MGQRECFDYITRLERSFQIACGREHLSNETRDAFLFSQLQAGLKMILIESPAVSGSVSYKQLCITAKQEEKRQNVSSNSKTNSSELRVPGKCQVITLLHSPLAKALDHHVNVMFVARPTT